MKKLLIALASLVALLVIGAGVLLFPAHLQIRHIEPELPSIAEVQALAVAEDGPVRISAIDVSVQRFNDRSIGNAVFLIEWADGRIFMVDAGMDEAGARDFSRTLALMGADDTLNYRGSVAQVLGERINRVQGVGFTHLHIDHVQGVQAFCERRGAGATAYQTTLQLLGEGLHTKESAMIVRSACLDLLGVDGEGLVPVPDFPGLTMLSVAGHTPGSTVFFVRMPGKLWVLSGDISNNKQDLLNDRGKGFLYSYLIVPENTRQLSKLRPWLAALDALEDTEVLVAHDHAALLQSEIEKLPRVSGQ